MNFYIISMLVVNAGAEYFLRVLKRNLMMTIGFLIFGIIVFFFITLSIFLGKISVSLDPGKIVIYIYGAIILIILLFSINYLFKLKRKVPLMTGFVNYFVASFVLITISTLQYLFHYSLQGTGVSMLQIVYVSHFLFYGALSFMFLAFARLTNLGGVYKGIKKNTGSL